MGVWVAVFFWWVGESTLAGGRNFTHWRVLSGDCTWSLDCLSRSSNSSKPCLIIIEPSWTGTVSVWNPVGDGRSDRLFVDGVPLSPTEMMERIPSEYILWESTGSSNLKICPIEDPEVWDGSTCPWCLSGDHLVDPEHEMCGHCTCGPGLERGSDASDPMLCNLCEAGQFQARSTGHTCSACPLGYFAASAGATRCETCEVGWFAQDRTTCAPCETGPDQRFEQDFEKVRMLGSGAFGDVWHCKHRLDGKDYAVKLVDKNVTRSFSIEDAIFEAELSAGNALDHPHIVRYFTSWLQYRCPPRNSTLAFTNVYLQMEFCDGGSLYDWVRAREVVIQNGATPKHRQQWAREIGVFMKQSLMALEHLEKHGLLHRDIKPRNIFLTSDKTVRLGDFGLATWVKDSHSVDPSEEELSPRPGEGYHTRKAGTKIYMAPEQRHGRVYSFPADIHALGMTFVELLVPFTSYQQRKYTLKHLRRSMPSRFLTDFPNTTQLIMSMTERNPEARPTASQARARMPTIMEELQKFHMLLV